MALSLATTGAAIIIAPSWGLAETCRIGGGAAGPARVALRACAPDACAPRILDHHDYDPRTGRWQTRLIPDAALCPQSDDDALPPPGGPTPTSASSDDSASTPAPAPGGK